MASMPPPPPPTGGGGDRQTGTVKPLKAMEAWTLWDRIKHAARMAWLAFVAALK